MEKSAISTLIENTYNINPELVPKLFKGIDMLGTEYVRPSRKNSQKSESSITAENIMLTLDWPVYESIFSLEWFRKERPGFDMIMTLMNAKKYDVIDKVLDHLEQELDNKSRALTKKNSLPMGPYKSLLCEITYPLINFPTFRTLTELENNDKESKEVFRLWKRALDITAGDKENTPYVVEKLDKLKRLFGSNFTAHSFMVKVIAEDDKNYIPFILAMLNDPHANKYIQFYGTKENEKEFTPIETAIYNDNKPITKILLENKLYNSQALISLMSYINKENFSYVVNKDFDKEDYEYFTQSVELCLNNIDPQDYKSLSCHMFSSYFMVTGTTKNALDKFKKKYPGLVESGIFTQTDMLSEEGTSWEHMLALWDFIKQFRNIQVSYGSDEVVAMMDKWKKIIPLLDKDAKQEYSPEVGREVFSAMMNNEDGIYADVKLRIVKALEEKEQDPAKYFEKVMMDLTLDQPSHVRKKSKI